MINSAFYFMGFFMIGNVVGKTWIEKLKNPHFRKISSVISLFLFAGLFVRIGGLSADMNNVVYHTKLLMAFFIMMSISSWFNDKSYLSLVRFYGENSLTILGLHTLPLVVVNKFTLMLWGKCTPFMGFVQSVIVMVVMYYVILFCNRYIPFLVGKKVVKKVQPQEAIITC